jgi:hypothetical protein
MRKKRPNPGSTNYEVGKGRPPKATRWKPGQSGNSKGRPKGSRNVGAVLLDVIRQQIPVTENGRTRRIPALEVMLRRLANDAMRNDAGALKLVLSLVDRYAEPSEAELRIDEMLAEDQEILAQYLDTPSAPEKESNNGDSSHES